MQYRPTLQKMLATQGLVRCIVDRLANAEAAQIDPVINECLGDLGRHLGVDRAYIFMIDGEIARNTHEWCSDGITPEISNLQYVPTAEYSFWLTELSTVQSINIPDVSKLTEDRKTEPVVFEAQGIQSLVAVPMISLGKLVGFAGLDCVRQPRSFLGSEIDHLSTIADRITTLMVSRDAKHEVQRAQARLTALTQHVSDFVLVVDDTGKASYLSPSLKRLGFDQTVWNNGWLNAMHPDDAATLAPIVDQVIRRVRGPVTRLPDCRVRGQDGSWHWIEATVSDLRQEPAVAGLVISAHEISERKLTEARLAKEALLDSMTGLGNRQLLAVRMNEACDRIQAESGSSSVFFLDIDGFKTVNDGMGHHFGDQMLIAVAMRLRDLTSGEGTLARFGGDEFVYMSESISEDDDLAAFGAKLFSQFREPLLIGEQQFQVTVSIGAVVVSAQDFPITPERILADADAAMYQAKREGRNRLVRFDESHRNRAQRFSRIQQRLSHAIHQRKLNVQYQPIVELSTGRLLGVESLLRWTDEELGTVSPGEFVPVAEESGLIADLDKFVLEATLDNIGKLPDDIFISLNVSAHLMTLNETSDGIVAALDHRDISGKRLCIEVTETAILDHPEAAAATLRVLKKHDIKTALDDFGTGASSLAVLRELPVDVLKIDRSFVSGATDSSSDQILIRAVMGLAEDFGMQVTAEGIETGAQRQLLIEYGCNTGQGYLFSPAVPADEIKLQYQIHD